MKRRSNSSAPRPVTPGVRTQAITGTQAVLRAVTLLQAVARSRGDEGVTELARSTGLSKASAFRVLGALEHTAMLRRDASGAYHLGPAVIALGATALRSAELREVARDELATLVKETGETATLEVLVGNEVVILEEVQGRFLLGSMPEVGTRWPAYATSTGKVLLAALEHEVHPGRMVARTPRTITTPERLARELARVRERGYATGIEELEDGFIAIAAPVRDHDARAVAAVSIGGPSARLRRKGITELARAVRGAADRISDRLGAPATMPESHAATHPAPARRGSGPRPRPSARSRS